MREDSFSTLNGPGNVRVRANNAGSPERVDTRGNGPGGVEIGQSAESVRRRDQPGRSSIDRCSHSRSNGTVTGRFWASERRSSAASVPTSVRMSRRPCASR